MNRSLLVTGPIVMVGLLWVAAFTSPLALAQTVITYPNLNYTQPSSFTLKANSTPVPAQAFLDYHYAHLSFGGLVTFELTAPQSITSFTISPKSFGINATVNGNKLTFSLQQGSQLQPYYLIIKINNLANFLLLADPLEVNVPPSSGSGIYNVRSATYNADNTGAALVTLPLQQAIDDASATGGGTVYVPAGHYKVTSLILKSNVHLYLAGGAVIRGSSDTLDYPLATDGKNHIVRQLLIVVGDNVKITGRGELDANGTAMVFNGDLAIPKFRRGAISGKINGIIKFLTVEGVSLKDANSLTVLLFNSQDVTFTNVKSFNDTRRLRNDGLDIYNGQRCTIDKCFAYSGDDAISIKGIDWVQHPTNINQTYVSQATTNVTYKNCVLYSNACGIDVGLEVFTPVTGVRLENIDVVNAVRGLAVNVSEVSSDIITKKTASNVYFKDIRVERLATPPNYPSNIFYNSKPIHLEIDKKTGNIRDVNFENVTFEMFAANNSLIRGSNANATVDGVTFTNLRIAGQLITNSNYTTQGHFTVDPYAYNVTFNPGTTTRIWDFEDASGGAKDWSPLTGAWSVIPDGSKVYSQTTATGTHRSLAGNGDWTNYALQAKVKLITAGGVVRLIARYRDEATFYYLEASQTQLTLRKVAGGTNALLGSAPISLSLNNWYTLKLELLNNSLTAYFGSSPTSLGAAKITTTDPTPLTNGRVGVNTFNAVGRFDDVTVTDLDGGNLRLAAEESAVEGQTDRLMVYPVPVSERLNVRYYAQQAGEVKAELHDIKGQPVVTTRQQAEVGEVNLSLGVDKLPPGLYFLQVSQGNQQLSKKVLITP